MTTKQAEWKEYTGSDEQIAEIKNAKYGLCLVFEHSSESFLYKLSEINTVDGNPVLSKTVTHYLICNPHPLADMIIRQAQTGQPVYTRRKGSKDCNNWASYENHRWDPEQYEYSFTKFKD